jgi:hypothetical protein
LLSGRSAMTYPARQRLYAMTVSLPTSILCVMLTACSITGSAVRTWVDEGTAVAVTAQKHATVFYRDDVQVGVEINDFVDLGAFEINQSGTRHQYLSLLAWSTLARTPEQQSRIEDRFANLVIWADDQPMAFKRYTQNREMLHVSRELFKRFSPTPHENYYEISIAQLATLVAAKELRIGPADQQSWEALYRTWHNEQADLAAFTNEVSNTAKLINPQTK